MYWIDYFKKIQRANLDGTGVEDLVIFTSYSAFGIALNVPGGKMYWILTSGKIQRANLDGTEVEALLDIWQPVAYGIALDMAGGKMYWTAARKIRRANLDGTEVEDVITSVIDPGGIALDIPSGKVYWADYRTDAIHRANLDGTSIEDVVTGLERGPFGIALDLSHGKMYWTIISTPGKIQRANLDGTSVEDVLTGLKGPYGIALDVSSIIIVDIDIKPNIDPNSINPKSKGVIPVAILTTATFDATTVDPLSVEFGPNGATESHGKGHIEDVDGDGDMDLVLHFKTQDPGIQCGDTEASLTGQTYGGQTITGTDAIQTVGCSSAKAMAEAKAGIPAGYTLLQNYPNPFNPETEIRFQLPEANHVVVKIFNTIGEEIRTLVEAPYQAGYHRVRWDGKDKNGNAVASGLYLYQLQAGGFSQVRKMSLLR